MRRLTVVALLWAWAASASAQTVTTYTDRLVLASPPAKSTETDCLWRDATTGMVATGACLGSGANTFTGKQTITLTTSPQLQVGYDAGTNYMTVGVSSAGAVTFDTNGSSNSFTFSDPTTFSSTLTANGTTSLNGSSIGIGNATSDTVTVTARIGSGLTWSADATYDIGASGANRPNHLYLAGNAAVGGTLGVTSTTTLTGTTTIGDAADLTRATYASQTTGWRVTSDGSADFRYLFVDELHAKSFIADLEQALAGGQIIAKSVAMVASAFSCPAAGAATPLLVRDLPSMPNTAAFVANDWVVLRTFSRSGGTLSVAECVGQVTNYADGSGGGGGGGTPAEGQQSWTFTRGTGACAGVWTSGTIAVDSLAIDYGVSGQGYAEVTAADGAYGANSPYYQVVTWDTCPVAVNRKLRARWGNLNGSYGYSSSVYGFAAGDPSATYFTLEPTNGLQMYTGATKKFWLTTGGAMALYDSATTYLQFNAGAINLVENSVTRLQLASSGITVGPTSTSHLTIDATNGLQFKNGSGVVLGSLNSSTLTLGQPLTANNTGQILIDSDSIDFKWRNNSGTTSTLLTIDNNGGVGWVSVAGTLAASADVRTPTVTYATGDLSLVVSNSGSYVVVRTVGGGLRPYANDSYNLGNSTYRWSAVYATAYYAGTTAGVDGTCSSVTVTKGIVTGCTP